MEEKKKRSFFFPITSRLCLSWSVPIILIVSIVGSMGGLGNISTAEAASLVLSPSTGTFTVGSTFSVSVFLNTENEAVNTIGTSITFPPDKLQIVSPSTGNSIINIWTNLPNVDNQNGRISLQGGIPGGIKVTNGLITTLIFRVKSVGTAVVKFTDSSRVLLNDGQGTDDLKQTTNGVYQLVLPPPAGPIVTSETHPDQTQWYPNASAALEWAAETDVDGYSYIVNGEPVDFPDDIAEGTRTTINYRNLTDGIHYFHIKALKDKGWGGTTHYALKIDTGAPAKFPIEIIPDARTTRRQPVFQFSTTDALSGIDHYELKIIPLKVSGSSAGNTTPATQPLFIDVNSPYVPPELPLGTYDVVVRAYDKAGNLQEIAQRLNIVTSVFRIIQDQGIQIRNSFLIPWKWFWILLIILLLLLTGIAWRVRRWHRQLINRRQAKDLSPTVQQQLDELKKYREKYGKVALGIIFIIMLWSSATARAETVALVPPLITTVAKNISNDEIFYVGGNLDVENATVILYLQNVSTGETISESTISQKGGEWFYRHSGFLTGGNYVLWAQSKVGSQLSPPSPQVELTVRKTAFIFGASRISLEAIYLVGVICSIAVILALILHILFHTYHGRKRHKEMLKEIKEAEESVRRGFAVLRRDIEAELAIIHKIKMSKE
ncbi:MAG TPA: cohesin domain-containing protein, partial [Patescibacteria group bacterium]|nr:cohesin domain-containing protein [Patescibacteria group bacterium]